MTTCPVCDQPLIDYGDFATCTGCDWILVPDDRRKGEVATDNVHYSAGPVGKTAK